ncbi:MAG: DUF3516 domain-containing protein [Atopobiaceae bacterium]|nr:DUF3516 domain-containing protein [Atopobiaceae bacterium]
MPHIDAFAYGSLGALAPDFEAGEEPLEGEESLELFMDWLDAREIEPWEHQEEALLSLAMGNHVVLGTPTGSGKSLVAIGMCFMALCADYTAYYTAPIKALVSEKFFDLVDLFGRDYVGMITGDVSINPGAPIVCCTQEILANQALREGEDTSVAWVAMDEFHYFADHDRGWAWQVPLITLRRTKFLLMSATLGDMTAIAELMERQTDADVDLVLDAPRPVPLSYEFVETSLEATVELAVRKGDAPIYIVHFAQDAALRSAQALASFGVSDRAQRDALREACKDTRFTTAFGKTLRRLLLMGVGVHHAGMLPRYRLLVEKLAQQGLLPVICGTDTLGVGINVPIHTVLLTALAKYDGKRQRRLNAREFHQIAGRAGRAGFDTEGVVLVQATEYDVERAKALAKAGGDPKRARKVHTRKPPEGFVGWNKQTFERLVEATPEPLHPRLKISHSMVLAEVSQGGDAWERVRELIDASMQTDEQKEALRTRADEIFATLMDAGVVVREETDDWVNYYTTVDVPTDFALDQPLSPFLLAAIELLDRESETYVYDVISLVESTLEQPYQILRAQEKSARSEAMARMKADGVEYEERMERIQEVTYPMPLAELIEAAFATYCEKVPWANDYEPHPKSVLRDMLETASDFKGYIQRCNIARAEGILLRYLSEAYRSLSRTLPLEARDERLEEIIAWLGLVVRSVDSSLVDEWARTGELDEDVGAFEANVDAVVADRRAVTLLVRNALFARVRMAAHDDWKALGELDADWGWSAMRWRQVLDEFYEEHEDVLLDADARSTKFFSIDDKDEQLRHVWHVSQTFADVEGEHDFGIMADLNLDATQDIGEAVFKNYRVGFVEDLWHPEED